MLIGGQVRRMPADMWHGVNTDAILPAAHLRAPEAELGRYAFAGVLPEFQDWLGGGEVLVAGDNFGCGSSREQACKALLGCGIRLVVAESFGSIFFRNALNLGLALLRVPGTGAQAVLADGVRVEADLATGAVTGPPGVVHAAPLPPHAMRIVAAGGILPLLREDPGALG